MITHLEVENFRAYGRFSLDLKEGVNFIVGPNAIGKTSLLEAIALALVGGSATVDRLADLMRAPAEASRVALTFVQGGTTYQVERTIEPNGHRGDCYLREGDQQRVRRRWEDLTATVESLFGTTTAFFARIIYMSEGDVFRFVHEAPGRAVMAQIDRLLGIDRLEALDNALAQSLRAVRDRLGACEKVLAECDEERDALAQHVTEFDVDEALSALPRLDARISELETALEQGGAHRGQLEGTLRELTRVESDLIALGELLGAAGPQEADDSSLLERLSQRVELQGREVQAVEQALDDARDYVGRLKGQTQAYEDALRLLQPPDLSPSDTRTVPCPVCRKPLTHDERSQIVRDTRRRIDEVVRSQREAEATLAGKEKALRESQAVLRSLRTYAARITEWAERYPEVTSLKACRSRSRSLQRQLAEVDDASTGYRDELKRLRQTASRLSVLKHRLEGLGFGDLGSLRRGLVTYTKAQLVFEASRRAVAATVHEQRDQNLQEVYQQIADTWRTFVERSEWSVQFAMDGSPSLRDVAEDRTFGLGQLSGGEKTAFLTIIHSILASRFSTGRFMMVDEPLEHLDPINRRSLVRFFVDALESGLFEQMIVTTFEESLVRKYLSAEGVNVIYLDAYRPEFRLLVQESA